ncbi:MAG: superoxide dismutase [Reyranella sp.]|uniref:superoxide dismutase n=1 Tax=Reyranella sp. TaxID=1929291 RepID=UPI00121CE8A6|nr:superoxide dismutase [Reyranella sp.]TAJ37053.1 MAG: superoxide dismutase [Reyranella sp.]
MPLDKAKAPFTLPKLPYAEDALAPVISAKTISFHYGKHHATYIKTLNELIAGTAYEGLSLGEIVARAAGDKDAAARKIFNNAAQAWNHDFYWHSMTPPNGKGSGAPTGKIKDALEKSFGDLDAFKKAFSLAAVGQFGSGWAWLVKGKDGALKIEATSNADSPIARGGTPLLVADVWEHAYYLDYQNRRPDHIAAWLDKLVNWSFAEDNLGQ